MNRIMDSTMKRITVRGLFWAACIISLAMQPFTAGPAVAATTLPVLWTAGGVSTTIDNAGQAARMTTDASGNVAVVSGPAGGSDLAVTSYTAAGSFRWRSAVSPSSTGTFVGAWVVAAPNGDFLAVGYTVNSNGRPVGSTLVRYASDGTLRWRVDLVTIVSRLVVDSGGNAYLTIRGFDIQLLKYNPSGVLLWSTGNSTGSYIGAQSLALSPDETDVVLAGYVIGGATWVTAAFNAATGAPKWLVMAAEGNGASDVVVDVSRVYVTGAGNVGGSGFLTVVAYDRATGVRLWRTDSNPPVCCAYGDRIALAPDGSLAIAGQAYSGGYFDWWIVAMDNNGVVRWQARRDRAATGDEIPAAVFVLADGTTVVSGSGGPTIQDALGTHMQGVTAGYSPNGTLLWEAFSRLPAVWATALPDGDVCATGGFDALITCWQISGVVTNQPLRSTAIDLSATLQGKKVIVTGNVAVRDGSGAAVSGAVVSATWAIPGGVTVAQTATTSSTGIASFSTTGGRGAYTLTVTNISKTGYTFDAANSVLTKSITK